MGEHYVAMDDFAYTKSIDINEFKAVVILHAFDKCLLHINETTVSNFLSWLNETEKIDPLEYSNLTYTPDFESLSQNFTFNDLSKQRFKDLNTLTAEVNKEVATEVRKY